MPPHAAHHGPSPAHASCDTRRTLSALRAVRTFAELHRGLHAVLFERHRHRLHVGVLHRPSVARFANLHVVRHRRLLGRVDKTYRHLSAWRHVERAHPNGREDPLRLLGELLLDGVWINRIGATCAARASVGIKSRRLRTERHPVHNRFVALETRIRQILLLGRLGRRLLIVSIIRILVCILIRILRHKQRRTINGWRRCRRCRRYGG